MPAPSTPPESPRSGPAPTGRAAPQPAPGRLLLRWGVSAIGAVLVALGSFNLWTAHYFGRTTKLGGAQVHLDGSPALAMGLATLCLGLLSLAVWLRGKGLITLWCGLCLTGAGGSFIWALQLLRSPA